MPSSPKFRAGLLLLVMFHLDESQAAELKTGADLARGCRDRETPGPCINYLLNVVEGHEAFAKWGAVAHRWCMPDVPHTELRKAYLRFFDAHPELGDSPVSEVTVEAFAATYPCAEVEETR